MNFLFVKIKGYFSPYIFKVDFSKGIKSTIIIYDIVNWSKQILGSWDLTIHLP